MITLGLVWLSGKYGMRFEFLYVGTVLIDITIVENIL